ncbi:hypothetical protein [Sulfuricurvum sp.]|uniref:tetratricopeptide repeat protein n=1 Tax=Sulfuricurvum sp. TaxID=2025608 RepID=UPI00286DE181|nr:hypothetical protein [Sulfuricurvum sp.]
MKKSMGFIITAVVSVCFADTLDEGKIALEQKRYFDAVEAFTKACESGNGIGCYNLGVMYEKGEGIAQNKYKASTLYTQACRANVGLGCSSMALSYDTP